MLEVNIPCVNVKWNIVFHTQIRSWWWGKLPPDGGSAEASCNFDAVGFSPRTGGTGVGAGVTEAEMSVLKVLSAKLESMTQADRQIARRQKCQDAQNRAYKWRRTEHGERINKRGDADCNQRSDAAKIE